MTDPRPLLEPARVEAARKAQAEFGLCDACLGRRFAKVETGLSNEQRGRIVLDALRAVRPDSPDSPDSPDLSDERKKTSGRSGESGLTSSVAPADCFVCRGLLLDVDQLAEVAIESLAPFEHRHFLVGTRVDPAIELREQEVNLALGTAETAERIQSELNRETGKRVAAKTEKPVEFKDPDLTIVIDSRFLDADVQHGGMTIFGRYRKLSREIPQTKWPCRRCGGQGCVNCKLTGRQYQDSVEDFVAKPFMEATGATDKSFHGAGREDIDARALGRGRPFILELKDPRIRTIDLSLFPPLVEKASGGTVEIHELRWAPKKEIAEIKEHRGSKTYLATVTFPRPIARPELDAAIAQLRGKEIQQRTPERVQHRRADLVRARRVLAIDVESATEDGCVLRIHGDAGLYIKELVTGDDGRTEPSLSGILGALAKVAELDIVDVEYEGPGPGPGPGNVVPGPGPGPGPARRP